MQTRRVGWRRKNVDCMCLDIANPPIHFGELVGLVTTQTRVGWRRKNVDCMCLVIANPPIHFDWTSYKCFQDSNILQRQPTLPPSRFFVGWNEPAKRNKNQMILSGLTPTLPACWEPLISVKGLFLEHNITSIKIAYQQEIQRNIPLIFYKNNYCRYSPANFMSISKLIV